MKQPVRAKNLARVRAPSKPVSDLLMTFEAETRHLSHLTTSSEVVTHSISLPKLGFLAKPDHSRAWDQQNRRIIALWDDGKDTQEIAEAVGWSQGSVVAVLSAWRDAKRAVAA